MPTTPHVTLPKLWLASQSPRRAQLLENLGLSFQVAVSSAEEADLFEGTVEATVLENARRKAAVIASKVTNEADVVIAADTLVALGEKILSKPANRAEAVAGLQALSGAEHRVLTGLALHSRRFGTRQTCVQTKVWFRNLAQEEIEGYADTREPYDKAGGYGIQGLGSLFVLRIEGSYSNVMGLPVETLLPQLAALTGTAVYQWFPQ